jgi:hypothetical protein
MSEYLTKKTHRVVTTEAEDRRELTQYSVLPSLARGEWPRGCDLYD